MLVKLVAAYLTRTVRVLRNQKRGRRKQEKLLSLRKQKLIASLSKADIYYLTAEISFTKRKRKMRRKVWIVSCFLDPKEIVLYDIKTMSRLKKDIFHLSKSIDQAIQVSKIFSAKKVGRSQLTMDEQRRADNSSD